MSDEGAKMTSKETIVRKKPTIRKSTVIKDSSVTPRVRKTAVKKIVVTKQASEMLDESENKKRVPLKVVLLMMFTALISSGITFAVTSNTSAASAGTSTFTEVTAGKVALTESELFAAVKKLGVDVYWAGPVRDAKYTLAVPADGQAYIRYLPNGKGIEDTKPNYVVIATYSTTDAFTSTQAAGNTSNGVTFINTEGAAVYYSKDTPTNVYVAYPNLNYQIEIFDPIGATALEIASKTGALKLVK